MYGKADKAPLELSPFVREFQFGGSNEYWTSNHMTIQTEDCIDCLKVLYDDKYDFVFLFDHSSGHAKKRLGGLDVKQMNRGWGGAILRDTIIEDKDGFLGPYHDASLPWMVKVGDTQSLVYKTEKDLQFGPVELSDEQREARREDDMVDLPKKSKGKPKKKLKAEFIADLLPTDVGKLHGEIGLKKKVLTELQEICTKLGINIQKTETQRRRLGWEGQGKGLLQVLAERGWIDLSNIKKYKMVATDSDGNIVPEYSLTHLMGRCTDFANEKSQLEYVCEKLGARAVTTTKYHAEYAGEGIEYAWDLLKLSTVAILSKARRLSNTSARLFRTVFLERC